MPDIEKQIVDSIVTTGLYRRPILKQWEIWLVEKDGKKSKIGISVESLGIEAAKELWQEFAYVVQNKIESIYQLIDKEQVQ